MLNHFRDEISNQIAQTLCGEPYLVLTTSGPVGLQVGRFFSTAQDLWIQLLVPSTLDLLSNLDGTSRVILTAPTWQVRGTPQILEPANLLRIPALARRPEARWCTLVQVSVERFERFQPQGWGSVETFDIA